MRYIISAGDSLKRWRITQRKHYNRSLAQLLQPGTVEYDILGFVKSPYKKQTGLSDTLKGDSRINFKYTARVP